VACRDHRGDRRGGGSNLPGRRRARPFLSISRGPGTEGKVTSSRGRTDYQDGLRKPPNENELL
jgi:hypothetical protein